MQNTFTIDADIKKTSYFNEPTVTSNDDITFVVNISDDGQAFDLADVTTVSLANTKPDKEVVVTPGVISGLNQVTFVLGTNETAISGSVSAVVQLYDASGRVSTLSFSYAVKVDPTGSGYVPSTDEQTLIEVVLNDGPLRIQEAIDAGVYANLQGDYALAQGDIAATESALASTATVNANTATTSANTAAATVTQTNTDVQTAENTRVTNENTRITNENTRESQESDRQTNTATAITNTETATINANTQGDYATAQGDYAKSSGDTSITKWLSPVSNFAAIGTTYTTPTLGDTVQVLDNGYVYRFNGTGWIYTQGYSATAIADVNAQLADYANKFYDNAGAHNSIYRGKYLGASLTSAQQTAISSGTFEDLYIGDYWTIGGINYRIAGFNYFRNVGDTALTANHVTIVPDTVLYNAQMNATNVTTGGYVNSEMRTTNLASAITTIETAFPGVVNHRQILTNATTNSKASGWSWYDSKVELMNEVMVYGSVAWGEATYNSGYNVGSSHGRLPLFALRQDMVNIRQTYWLRDVVSAAFFARASHDGDANYNDASGARGVRPAFSIS